MLCAAVLREYANLFAHAQTAEQESLVRSLLFHAQKGVLDKHGDSRRDFETRGKLRWSSYSCGGVDACELAYLFALVLILALLPWALQSAVILLREGQSHLKNNVHLPHIRLLHRKSQTNSYHVVGGAL